MIIGSIAHLAAAQMMGSMETSRGAGASSFQCAASLDVGMMHTCHSSINSGQVNCIGLNDWGQAPGVPSLPLGQVAVAAGDAHTCALSSTGATFCWGVGPVPPPSTGVQSIASGGNTTCVVFAATNNLQCWGDAQPPPAIISGVLAVSIGHWHACALMVGDAARTTNVACWGGPGADPIVLSGAPTAGNFSAVSAGWQHTCALSSSGGVFCWGRGLEGQTDTSAISALAVQAVSAGGMHTLALLQNGSVRCFGDNAYGQCNNGVLGTLSNVKSISAGMFTSCVLQQVALVFSVTCYGENPHSRALSAQTSLRSYVGHCAPTPSPTGTATSSGTRTSTATATGSGTATVTPAGTGTRTSSASPAGTPSSSGSPSNTPSRTATPSTSPCPGRSESNAITGQNPCARALSPGCNFENSLVFILPPGASKPFQVQCMLDRSFDLNAAGPWALAASIMTDDETWKHEADQWTSCDDVDTPVLTSSQPFIRLNYPTTSKRWRSFVALPGSKIRVDLFGSTDPSSVRTVVLSSTGSGFPSLRYLFAAQSRGALAAAASLNVTVASWLGLSLALTDAASTARQACVLGTSFGGSNIINTRARNDAGNVSIRLGMTLGYGSECAPRLSVGFNVPAYALGLGGGGSGLLEEDYSRSILWKESGNGGPVLFPSGYPIAARIYIGGESSNPESNPPCPVVIAGASETALPIALIAGIAGAVGALLAAVAIVSLIHCRRATRVNKELVSVLSSRRLLPVGGDGVVVNPMHAPPPPGPSVDELQAAEKAAQEAWAAQQAELEAARAAQQAKQAEELASLQATLAAALPPPPPPITGCGCPAVHCACPCHDRLHASEGEAAEARARVGELQSALTAAAEAHAAQLSSMMEEQLREKQAQQKAAALVAASSRRLLPQQAADGSHEANAAAAAAAEAASAAALASKDVAIGELRVENAKLVQAVSTSQAEVARVEAKHAVEVATLRATATAAGEEVVGLRTQVAELGGRMLATTGEKQALETELLSTREKIKLLEAQVQARAGGKAQLGAGGPKRWESKALDRRPESADSSYTNSAPRYVDEVFSEKLKGTGGRAVAIPVDLQKALARGISYQIWHDATHDSHGRQTVFSLAVRRAQAKIAAPGPAAVSVTNPAIVVKD